MVDAENPKRYISLSISPKHAQLASSAPPQTDPCKLDNIPSAMHSSLNRAQSVFGFFTTVALVVAGLAALSVLLFPTDAPTASVQLKNVQV